LFHDFKYQAIVIIPYVKGISEKFRRIGKSFNVKTILKAKDTFHGTIMKSGPVRYAQQTKQCVYNIPRECDRCYVGETSRPLEVFVEEHKYSYNPSKLARHSYKEGHEILWKEAKVLKIEPNTTYRKYKETAHVSLVDHPISQPSLDTCPIWAPITEAEVRKQLRPV
jgi:hypothetical protein